MLYVGNKAPNEPPRLLIFVLLVAPFVGLKFNVPYDAAVPCDVTYPVTFSDDNSIVIVPSAAAVG